MKHYAIILKGFDKTIAIIEAESAGKAKYKCWLKTSDAGYWHNFFDFCKSCRVITIG